MIWQEAALCGRLQSADYDNRLLVLGCAAVPVGGSLMPTSRLPRPGPFDRPGPAGEIPPAYLAGGTFTLNNQGMLGVDRSFGFPRRICAPPPARS